MEAKVAKLSKRVAEEIDKRGMKRRFVARKLGLTDNRMSLIINGHLPVRVEEALRLADLFGLDVQDVIEVEEAVNA